MALINRYKHIKPRKLNFDVEIPNVSKRKHLLSSNNILVLFIFVTLLALIIISRSYTFISHLTHHGSSQYDVNGAWVLDGKDKKYSIYVKFHNQTIDDVSNRESHSLSSGKGNNGDSIIKVSSLGPHRVIILDKKSCESPPIWIRIVGDSIIPIPLTRQPKSLQQKDGGRWEGQFTLPMDGRYKIEERWYDCVYGKGKVELSLYETTNRNEFIANTTTKSQWTDSDLPPSMFGTGAWISTKKIDAIVMQPRTNHYVWTDPQRAINQTISLLNVHLDLKIHEDTTDTNEVISKEGTVSPQHGFYSFSELGNYEIVCFVGSQSAAQLHSAFLAIRPHIFPHNRPFKFHYKEMTSFIHPDATWSTESKAGFRKCKQILVSIDEVEGIKDGTSAGNDAKKEYLSYNEYLSQITTFINHLIKAFDETFPIWIFSIMEPPMLANNCFNTTTDGEKILTTIQNNEHPCNILLKNLFNRPDGTSSVFPNRVRLLDNTDLSLAHWERSEHNSIVATVALRIFVLVGQKVKEWRSVGQRGTVKGLVRNGITEPNFELIPYNFN